MRAKEEVYEVEVSQDDLESAMSAVKFTLEMFEESSVMSEMLDLEFIQDLNKAFGILLLLHSSATKMYKLPVIKKELS